MDVAIIHDYIEALIPRGGIPLLQDRSSRSRKRALVFRAPEAVPHRSRCHIERTDKIVRGILAGCHDCHPGCQRASRPHPLSGGGGCRVHQQRPALPRLGDVRTTQRIRAKRSTRSGALSLATSLARFHIQPSAWRQRRTVSAQTVRPVAWRCNVRASVAQLQRVRHQPYAWGVAWSSVSSAAFPTIQPGRASQGPPGALRVL